MGFSRGLFGFSFEINSATQFYRFIQANFSSGGLNRDCPTIIWHLR